MNDRDNNNEKRENREMPEGSWLAIGIGVGVALGTALGNVGIGIALGVAIGASLDASQRKKTEQDDNDSELE